jgi:hypothetical protein
MLPAITGYPVLHSADYFGCGWQKQQQYTSDDSFFETYKTMLLDDAEGTYNRLVKEMVNRIMTSYTSDKSSSLLPADTVNNQTLDEKKGDRLLGASASPTREN